MRALILAADGFEDLELFYCWHRLTEAGVDLAVAGPTGQPLTGSHGYRLVPDFELGQVNPSEFDLLILPGGAAPERLRLREQAVDIVRTFSDEDRRIVAIGHGPQLLLSAGVLSTKSITCSPAIRDDVKAAGADYRDEAVVVDGLLTTCRGIDDLAELGPELAEITQLLQ